MFGVATGLISISLRQGILQQEISEEGLNKESSLMKAF